MTIAGNLALGAVSTLAVHIGPAAANFDKLTVNGNLTITKGAALQTTLLGGFTPVNGNVFPIINATSITGALDGILPTNVVQQQTPTSISLAFNFVCSGTICFDNSAGDFRWNNPLNWSTDVLPGTQDNVAIELAGNNTIRFDSGAFSINKLFLASNNTLNFTGGSLDILNQAQFDGRVVLASGTLGGAGNFMFTGQFDWSGGTLTGSGTTLIDGSDSPAQLHITGTGDHALNRSLTSNVDVDWQGGSLSGSGDLTTTGAVQINTTATHIATNPAITANALKINAGTLELQRGDLTLANNGEVDVAAGATFLIDGGDFTHNAINNHGTVQVVAVNLLNVFGDQTGGVFDVDSESSLVFNGGTNTFAGSRIQGGGQADVFGVATINGAGLSVSGTDTLLDFVNNANVNGDGTLTTATGTKLALFGGTLANTGTITVNGDFQWGGGTIRGPGVLTTTGTTSLLVGNAPSVLINRIWNHTGVITWTGGDVVLNDANAILNNQAGGVINVALVGRSRVLGNGILHNLAGATLSVGNNSNTVIVQSGFTNDGTLVLNNELDLQKDFTNHGLITLGDNGSLVAGFDVEFPAPNVFANGSDGTITGTGTIDVKSFDNIAFVNNGVIAPGTTTDPTGTLFVDGNFVQSATGKLAVDLGGATPGTTYDVLNVSGQASLGGTLQVALTNSFVPAPGALFNVVAYQTTSGDFAQRIQPSGRVLTASIGTANYQLQLNAATNTAPQLQPENTVLVFTPPDVLVNNLTSPNDSAALVTFIPRKPPVACK